MPNEIRLSEAKQKLLELQRRGSLASAADSFPKVSRVTGEPVPLSFAQEQVWRLEQAAGRLTPLYNESITIHRHGSCDPAVLAKVLAEIIRRHEIWRTTFEERGRGPVQVVHPPASFSLPIHDVRAAAEPETAALELATQDARQSFDLVRGPLLRARLVTLSDDEHRLFLTAHQSIVDGMTVYNVFPSELATLYESFALEKPSPLPELEVQFADFAVWQRQRLSKEGKEKQLTYWRKQLAGELPALYWPGEGTRPSQPTYRGAIHPFSFDQGLTESLRSLGHREGVTLFMILLAGLVTLLHRYTRQDDVIVGTLSPSGRKLAAFQRLLGYFLNPVCLRTNLSGNPTFRGLLQQAREVTLGAISNDDLSLETIAEQLGLAKDPIRDPFFTVALTVAPEVAPLPPGWEMTFMDVESGGARWNLYLELSERADGMIGRAQYNPDVFTLTTVRGLLDDLQEVLKAAQTDPSQPVAEISKTR